MPYSGALAAAGGAWRDATVGSGSGWLSMVLAWQAEMSGRLGAMGRCASTAGH